jgi:hypothetical protein
MKAISAAAVVAGLAAILGVSAIAQQQPAHPDFSGSYERYGNTFGQPTPAQLGDKTIPPRNPPAPLKPGPMKEYQDRLAAIREADRKGTPLASGYVNCLGDGMPMMMNAMFPIEFLITKNQVTVIEEAFTQVRRILLDRPQKNIDDVEPGFFGHSVGHWEGDTLVADTIGIKEDLRYQNVPHTKDLRINERIHLVAPNILWDEITMEDPTVLEKPWTVMVAYKKMPDYTLLEYICEDNREYKDANGVQQIHVGDTGRK